MSVKKIALAVLLITVSAVFVIPAAFAQQSKTYTSKKLNYAVAYPALYEVKEVANVVFFVATQKDQKYSFAANVNIMVKDLGKDALDFDSFYSKTKKNLRESMDELKIIEDKKEKIDGKQAHRLVYSVKQKKAYFKIMQVMIPYQQKVYLLTFTSLSDEYEKHLKHARFIINSIKIGK